MRRISMTLLPALALTAIASPSANADTVLYSNVTTFTGQGYNQGGAAADTGGGLSTAMVADDITVAAGAGGATVDSLTFSVANFNAAAVTAEVDLRFYAAAAGGGPGALIGGLNFNPISFTGGNVVSTFTYSPGSTIFTVPTSGTFYVGEFFTNDLTAATTAAQLNNLGEGIYNPPTVGSSSDGFYQSAGGSENTGSNPTSSPFFFGGNPVANFGFAFSGTPLTPVVPVPPSIVMTSAAGLLGLGGWGRRKLRKSATIA